MGDTAAIEAEGLVKHYGKTRALNGLDLTVARGTVYGLLGPNGAGKTTAVRVLATLLRADGGRARVLGHDVTAQAGAVRRVIGLTGQYAALDEYLTGRSNLVMIGELSRLTGRAARRRADELLEQFDLTDAAGRAVKTYSGGMRRRLDLAASLIGHPAVLFLDEPTTGLDPSARALMWGIVRQLVADGTTLLLTTQYLDEADQLADRIAVINDGKVIAEGTPAELKASMGGQRLLITLAEGSDASMALEVLGAFATGDISRARYDGGFGHRARSRGVRGYAFTWAGVCLGMVLRSAETAQQAGFIIFLPLTFISSAFVPTQGMPGWLQPVAEWNPMSSLAAACRQLFGNPNPAAAVHAWPAQHPELAVVCWSVTMLVVFAPLAVHLYRTKAH